MRIETSERWTAAAGLIGIALLVASTFSSGRPLATDATSAEVVRHYINHRTGALAGVALSSLAVPLLLPSVVIWRTRCLPRWTAIMGFAKAAASIPEIVGVFSREGVNAAGYA